MENSVEMNFQGGLAEFFKVCSPHSPLANDGGASEDEGVFVGSEVMCRGETCTVMYIGKVEYCKKNKVYVGVEFLQQRAGRNNGTVKGKTYFRGAERQCIMCSPRDIRRRKRGNGEKKKRRKKKEKKSPMARKSPLAAGGVANTQQRVGGTPVSREAFPESDEENFLPTTTTVGLKAQHHSNIFVGMNVLVFSRHKGIVRFVGPTHYSRKGKVYVGVEMSERKHGLNSGIVKGCRYFECKDGHGRIVAAEDVKAAGNNRI